MKSSFQKISSLAVATRKASRSLAILSTDTKNRVLREMAQALVAATPQIIAQNKKDLRVGEKKKLSAAMMDRLMLNEKRVVVMAEGLKEVASLPDPVGEKVTEWVRPNGLKVLRVRIPLGVIAVVYESRPNVTVDAAGLCFKSGNAVILRGGSEAFHSNQILGKILQQVLKKNKIPPQVISIFPTTDRKDLEALLQLTSLIDVAIPRGGESLMKFMEEHSKVPVIKHDKGVCNLFIDESADISKALKIVENAKVQRPGVCNSLENLLIHEKIAPQILPLLAKDLYSKGVELRGDSRARKIVKTIELAQEKDWSTEYLDLILSVKIVKNMEEALGFIQKYGSHHTEAIVTENLKQAQQFIRSLDSSCVVVNASTRFNDGGELGLGAEIGISTTKLHAYGPMGLEELTTKQFVVWGKGQIRL